MDLRTLRNKLPLFGIDYIVDEEKENELSIAIRDEIGDEPSMGAIRAAKSVINFVKVNYPKINWSSDACDEWVNITFKNAQE